MAGKNFINYWKGNKSAVTKIVDNFTTNKNVLDAADFSGQFGILRYAIEEANALPNPNFSPAVSKALAWAVRNQFDLYGKSNPGIDVTKDGRAIASVMSSPLDLRFITCVRIGDKTLGDLYPHLGQVKTVSDVADALWQSQDRGHIAQSYRLASMRQDFGGVIGGFADVLQELRLNQFERNTDYLPGTGEYDRYIQQTGFNLIKELTETEAQIASRTRYGAYEEEDDDEVDAYKDMNNDHLDDERDGSFDPSMVTDGGIDYGQETGAEFKGGSLADAANIPQGVGIDFAASGDASALLRRLVTGSPLELTGTDGNVYTIPGYNNKALIGGGGEQKRYDALRKDTGFISVGGVKIFLPRNSGSANSPTGLEGLSDIERFDAQAGSRSVDWSPSNHADSRLPDGALNAQKGPRKPKSPIWPPMPQIGGGLPAQSAPVSPTPQKVRMAQQRFTGGTVPMSEPRRIQRSPSGVPIPRLSPIPALSPAYLERVRNSIRMPQSSGHYDPVSMSATGSRPSDLTNILVPTNAPASSHINENIISAGAPVRNSLNALTASLARANGYPAPDGGRIRFGISGRNSALTSLARHGAVMAADKRGFASGQASAREFLSSLGIRTEHLLEEGPIEEQKTYERDISYDGENNTNIQFGLISSISSTGFYDEFGMRVTTQSTDNISVEERDPRMVQDENGNWYLDPEKSDHTRRDDTEGDFILGGMFGPDKSKGWVQRALGQTDRTYTGMLYGNSYSGQSFVSNVWGTDPVMGARNDADQIFKSREKSSDVTDEATMDGAAASNELSSYDDAVVSSFARYLISPSESYDVSAQIALSGIRDGWRKGKKITEYMAGYHRKRSNAEYAALARGGAYLALTAQNNPRPALPSGTVSSEPGRDIDPFAGEDMTVPALPSGTVATKKPKVIRKLGPDGKPMQTNTGSRVISSSSGETPNTKAPRRSLNAGDVGSRRNRDKTSVDILNEGMPIRVNMANPAGGTPEDAINAMNAAARAAEAARAAGGLPNLHGGGEADPFAGGDPTEVQAPTPAPVRALPAPAGSDVGTPNNHTTEIPRRAVSRNISEANLSAFEDTFRRGVGFQDDLLQAMSYPPGEVRDELIAEARRNISSNAGREETILLNHLGEGNGSSEGIDEARNIFHEVLIERNAPEVNGSHRARGTGGSAEEGSTGRTGERTARPNRVIQEAESRGSSRSLEYSPMIDPIAAGQKAFDATFGTSLQKYADDHFGGDLGAASSRANEHYENFMREEAANGGGKEYLRDNAESGSELFLGIASRQGKNALEDTVKFNKRMGSSTIEANFEQKKRDRDGGYLSGYSSMHGDYKNQEVVDQNGVTRNVPTISRDGVVTATPTMIDTSENIAKSALVNAGEAPVSSDPAAAAESIKSRVNSFIYEHVEKIADAMRKGGATETEIQRATSSIRDAAIYQANEYQKEGANALAGVTGNDTTLRNTSQIKWNARKPSSAKDLQTIMDERPGVKEQVDDLMQRSGKSLDELLNSPASEANLIQDGDMSFQLGGNGPTRGGKGGWRENFNMRAQPLAQGLYAAYMGKRMFSMAMAPIGAEIEKYGQYASEIGALGAGDSGSVLGGVAGATGRKAIGDTWASRGAYQAFGAFTDGNFFASQGGEGLARFGASAGVGATLGGEMALGGMLAMQLSTTPGINPALAGMAGTLGKALPIAGLAVFGAITGGTAVMELFNAANPDKDPVSWSSIATDLVKGSYRREAETAYLQDHPEKRATRDPIMSGLAQGIWDVKDTTYKPTDDELKKYLSPEKSAYTFSEKNPEIERSIKNAGMLAEFGLSPEQQAKTAAGYYKAFDQVFSPETVALVGPMVQKYGDGFLQEMSQYGSGLGYRAGSDELTAAGNAYAGTASPAMRQTMLATSSRNAQVASQASMYSEASDAKSIENISWLIGVKTQQQAGIWTGLNSVLSSNQASPLTLAQQQTTASIAATVSPMRGEFIKEFTGAAVMAGMKNPEMAMGYASNMSLNTEQTQAMGTFLSGDMQGMSYNARKSGDSSLSRFIFNGPGGNSIFETDGNAAMTMARQWSNTGFDWTKDSSSNRETASRMMSTENKDVLDAFMKNDGQGGFFGVQMLAKQKAYETSTAQMGLTFEGIAQAKKFNWGSGVGTNPGEGSMWGYENQERAMGHRFAEADFNMSETRMNTSNQFSVRRENLQYQGMLTSQSYNLWGQDTNYNQNLKQRGWMQQDYQFQDTNRELGLDRGLVDLNENIRFSSGRERRILTRHKDRFVQDYNLQDEQIGKERGRTTEVWALEDERYKKQKEYTIELNTLEVKNFELNKQQRIENFRLDTQDLARKRKELDEQYALREKVVTLTRDNEVKSLERQERGAAISAQALKDQHEYDLALTIGNKHASELMGAIGDKTKYEPMLKFANSLAALASDMAKVQTGQPKAVQDLIAALNGTNDAKVTNLVNMLKLLQFGN